MRYAFVIIIGIHGIIHLMGFIKAFEVAGINQLSQYISKPIGILWLLTSILFIATSISYTYKKDWWYVVAIICIIISQTLIILYWKDAKFGTIANSIILLLSISAYGHNQFDKMVQKETKLMLENVQSENISIISKADINHLPEIIQKWIQNSDVVGKEKVIAGHLKQIGKMRTKPESKWLYFTAAQHFNLENPAFIWTTKVDAMPIIKMIGRDKLYNGEGEMLIKLASLIPVVNQGKNDKINSGSMIRFLAEMCWFPSAALSDYIFWESIDETSAKATLTTNGKSVSGVFLFSDGGDLVSFETLRYYGSKNDSKLEKWFIKMDSYKVFNDIKIPNECEVIWKLKEGDFKWLDLEITDLEYKNSNQKSWNN